MVVNYNADSVRTSGFYSDKKWLKVRDFIRKRDGMTCQNCGDFTAKKYEVDHKTELNMENVRDWNIAYNPENLWLLCFDCHKRKTARDKQSNDRLFY